MEKTKSNPGSTATAELESPSSDLALRNSLALAVSLHLRGAQEDALKELEHTPSSMPRRAT